MDFKDWYFDQPKNLIIFRAHSRISRTGSTRIRMRYTGNVFIFAGERKATPLQASAYHPSEGGLK